MITSLPGDPIWIREGVLVSKEVSNSGLPIGIILNKPRRGIFLERKVINNIRYIQAYVDEIGERLIEENEVLELNSYGD